MNTNNPMQWTMQAKLNAVNDTSNTLKNDAKTLLISLNDFYDTMQDMQVENDAEQTRLFNEAMIAYKKLNEACGTLIAYEQNKYKS